jgi:predicted dinucleotide-binding enzyme
MNFDNGIWVLGAGGIGSALAKKIRQLAIEVE